jgi:hypothetical protein
MNANILGGLCLTLSLTGVAGAQSMPPSAPTPRSAATSGAYDYWAHAGLTCGTGASAAATSSKPTVQCGALADVGFFQLEAGVMGPQARQSNASGYLSANLYAPLFVPHGVALIEGGYTRMFETGHALDYGVGYARALDASHSLQFEVRDYWEFSNAHQHNVVFRVVWLVGVPD